MAKKTTTQETPVETPATQENLQNQNAEQNLNSNEEAASDDAGELDQATQDTGADPTPPTPTPEEEAAAAALQAAQGGEEEEDETIEEFSSFPKMRLKRTVHLNGKTYQSGPEPVTKEFALALLDARKESGIDVEVTIKKYFEEIK